MEAMGACSNPCTVEVLQRATGLAARIADENRSVSPARLPRRCLPVLRTVEQVLSEARFRRQKRGWYRLSLAPPHVSAHHPRRTLQEPGGVLVVVAVGVDFADVVGLADG